MIKVKFFSLLVVLISCGPLRQGEAVTDKTKQAVAETQPSGVGESVLNIDELTEEKLTLSSELLAPAQWGEAWTRKLSVGSSFSYLSIEKWDETRKAYLPIGFFDGEGNFSDFRIEAPTHYKIGGSYLSENFPAVFDVVLEGAIPCVENLLAERVLVRPSSVVLLGNCARKWIANEVIIEGAVRSFGAETKDGTSASSLHIQARTISGAGHIVLNGQDGRRGADGNPGQAGEDGKSGHPGGNGLPGGTAGDGGLLVLEGLAAESLGLSFEGGRGGAGGNGGAGGKAGPDWCYTVDGLRGSITRCQRGKDGPSGTAGSRGRNGRSGFVTKLGDLK